MDYFDGDDIDMQNELDRLNALFCKAVYDEVCSGNDVSIEDIEAAIQYFASIEEYDKCLVLKNNIKNRTK